jgi:hypothetical protein
MWPLLSQRVVRMVQVEKKEHHICFALRMHQFGRAYCTDSNLVKSEIRRFQKTRVGGDYQRRIQAMIVTVPLNTTQKISLNTSRNGDVKSATIHGNICFTDTFQ